MAEEHFIAHYTSEGYAMDTQTETNTMKITVASNDWGFLTLFHKL